LLTAFEKDATSTTTDTASTKGIGDTARYSSVLDDSIAQRIADFYSQDKMGKKEAKSTVESITQEVGKYVDRLIQAGKVRIIADAKESPDGVQGWTSDNGTITLVADQIAKGEAQAVMPVSSL